jgi:cytoskeletal protein RodZ
MGAVSMASFGETLKRERELREISLRQISEATKINLRYLEALEENRFDALPGGLFNKGFIRAYATYIGIDGEAMVNSYLQEISAHRPGGEPSSRGSNLHRPQEVPLRRAAAAGAERAPGPAMSSAQRRAQETRASAVADPNTPAHVPSPGETRATLAALERVLDQAPRPAVSGIDVADTQATASSRVLVWVLSFLAAAGVLFLIVSLVRGTMPGARRAPESPGTTRETTPGTPAGEAAQPPAETDSARGEPDGSVVVPEIAAQSPLILGAAGTPPTKTAAPARPAATPSRTPPPRQAQLPPPEPSPGDARVPNDRPGDDRPADQARQDDARPARGPMKTVVEARTRTYVVLACDGREVLNRFLEAGETERAKCDTVIRVSASDAGAVILSVNGETCLPLGDPGTRAYGYTIRVDDYARICPAGGGGADGRP